MVMFLGILTVGFVYEWKKGRWNGNNKQIGRSHPAPSLRLDLQDNVLRQVVDDLN